MATITFPTPSTLLNDQSAPVHPPTSVQRNSIKLHSSRKDVAYRKRSTRFGQDGHKRVKTQKPKQTKSRDGCITCKEKRLKCDETHPHCQQCKKRKVSCGGYKKTFTFRSVDKFSFPAAFDAPKAKISLPSPKIRALPPLPAETLSFDDDCGSNESFEDDIYAQGSSHGQSTRTACDFVFDPSPGFCTSAPELSPLEPTDSNPFYDTNPTSPEEGLFDYYIPEEDGLITPCSSQYEFSHPADLIKRDAAAFHPPMLSMSSAQHSTFPVEENDDMLPSSQETSHLVEQVQGQSVASNGACSPSSPSPSSTSIIGSAHTSLTNIGLGVLDSGFLHSLFHTDTCGILSIKNGERENPWTNMIWPLMLEERALYYAILSMTASHATTKYPKLRNNALELMTTSMQYLRQDLPVMRSDAALATTLVLAFSESWHSHIYTGKLHLRGARKLIAQGLNDHEQASANTGDMTRIRFLRGTWVYMDVIARLTAIGGEDPGDLDAIAASPIGPEAPLHDIDPLMGCATTLFPLIGAVANLVRVVRKTRRTPLQAVTRAASLRDQIYKWQGPPQLAKPKDPTLEIDHSRHTAEAYRFATLLYLFQAVPTICTQTPAELADETLGHLAAVPATSSATIIHIFPLLAASCEASTDEDRAFVAERWTSMMKRMCIGNIDRCWDVVKEVWDRRDATEACQRRRSSGVSINDFDYNLGDNGMPDLSDSPIVLRSPRGSYVEHEPGGGWMQDATKIPAIDPQMTVRGRLHWVAVMAEKKWEILLG